MGLLSVNTVLVAQETSKNFKIKQNSLELLFPYYNFMDGSPKLPLYYVGPDNFGIAYNRISKSQNSILNINFKYLQIWYQGTDSNTFYTQGDIIIRHILFYTGVFYKNLFTLHLPCYIHSVSLFTGTGINFRSGTELIHDSYFGWEELNHSRVLNDIGLQVSLLTKIDLPYNLVLTGNIDFLRYIYLYYTGIGVPSYDKGPTKNLITFQLGIGYRF